jgi:xanthine dehydrogenase small subunit
VLGGVVYGDDDAPSDALVAVPDALGDYHVAESLDAARRAAGLVQGRNTTVAPSAPIECPDGDWAVVLQTGWVEPAYLETDSAWCAPGGAPSDPLANAGAFGGKTRSPVGDDARRLADEHGRAVRVRWSREHVVRHGPKRPPMAIALRSDGTGVVRVARTAGIAAALRRVTDDVVIEEVDLAGPPTSADLRGAGWAELAIARAALSTPPGAPVTITAPDGATATATVTNPGSGAAAIEVRRRVRPTARPDGAAQLLHRRGPSSGRVGDLGGVGRRRGRDGRRPDDPLLRDRASGRHAGRRGADRR